MDETRRAEREERIAGAAYALAQAILTAVMVLTAPRGDDPLPHAIPKGI